MSLPNLGTFYVPYRLEGEQRRSHILSIEVSSKCIAIYRHLSSFIQYKPRKVPKKLRALRLWAILLDMGGRLIILLIVNTKS